MIKSYWRPLVVTSNEANVGHPILWNFLYIRLQLEELHHVEPGVDFNNYFYFFYFIAVPLDQLLKDPAEFQEFLYNKTNLSPRVISELLSSTVNVQKVSTCMLLLEAVSNFGMQHILGLSHWYIPHQRIVLFWAHWLASSEVNSKYYSPWVADVT